MTTAQAGDNVIDCSPSETMALNNLLNDWSIGVKSDNGSSYNGNISNLANTINSFDGNDDCEFSSRIEGSKKSGGKNPLCPQ